MKPIVLILSSAAAHIVFLYSAYGTKFFGLPLSYNAALALRLGVSAVEAGIGYAKVVAGLTWLTNGAHRRQLFAIMMSALPLSSGCPGRSISFGT